MKFKRDYKIIIQADTNDLCYLMTTIKGERKSNMSVEDYETIASMLDDVGIMIKNTLKLYKKL